MRQQQTPAQRTRLPGAWPLRRSDMDETTAAADHCTCPMDTPCRCGFAAMMSAIFFGDDA